MTEEKELVEETKEEETLEEALDEGQEQIEDAPEEGDVEEEEEAEEEPVDDRGVPLKNRIAELDRKLKASEKRETASLEREDRYKELLEKLNLNNKQEKKEAEDVLKSLKDEAFEAVGIVPEVAKVLRESQRREAQIAIAQRIAEADKQNQRTQATNKEFVNNRIGAIKTYQSGLDSEFGNLVVPDGKGGLRYDGSSKLFKRAKEIFESDGDLHNLAQGPVIAAQRAEVELIKEKYGKKTTIKTSKAEKLKGGPSGRTGKGGKMRDSKGNFTRPLSDKEFDKLDREDKELYMVAEVENRDKWFK